MSLCPHCNQPLVGVLMQPITGTATNGNQFNCVAYTCARCQKAISVDVDVTAVRSDIMNAIKQLAGGRP